MPMTSTYGSPGIARYRIAVLERAGVPDNAPELRAARARLAYLLGQPEPVGDDEAVAAYNDEHAHWIAWKLSGVLITAQPDDAIHNIVIKGVVSI